MCSRRYYCSKDSSSGTGIVWCGWRRGNQTNAIRHGQSCCRHGQSCCRNLALTRFGSPPRVWGELVVPDRAPQSQLVCGWYRRGFAWRIPALSSHCGSASPLRRVTPSPPSPTACHAPSLRRFQQTPQPRLSVIEHTPLRIPARGYGARSRRCHKVEQHVHAIGVWEIQLPYRCPKQHSYLSDGADYLDNRQERHLQWEWLP